MCKNMFIGDVTATYSLKQIQDLYRVGPKDIVFETWSESDFFGMYSRKVALTPKLSIKETLKFFV